MVGEALLLIFLGSVLGSAAGARQGRSPAWQGALITIIGIGVTVLLLTLFSVQSQLIGLLVWILAVGLAGGAFKMTGRQMAAVAIGSILFGVVAAVMAGFFGY